MILRVLGPSGQLAGGVLAELERGVGLGKDAEPSVGHIKEVV